MASITQTIPQFSLGMSEQPDQLKFPGQVREITNGIPDITQGLFKRPGARRIDTSLISDTNRNVSTDEGKLKNVYTDPSHATNKNGSWFHYFRDETEGSYIGQVARDGELRVWRCSDGRLMTTVYGTGGETALKAYLATNFSENLQFLTINDTTFVNSRDKNNPNTEIVTTFTATYAQSGTTVTITKIDHGLAVGENVNVDYTSGNGVDGNFLVKTVTTNTFTLTAAAAATTSGNVTVKPLTDATPHPHFAFLELLRSENGRQYGLNIHGQNTTVTNLDRATRVKITADTLDESDGTGTCPGIGTQVFSVDAATSYTGTTTNEVRSIPSGQTVNFTFQPSDVDVVNDHITINSHGMVSGQKVRYTLDAGATAVEGLPADTDYFVVKISDNVISLATTFALATATSPTVVNLGNTGNTGGTGSGTQQIQNLGVIVTSGKKNLIFRLNILGQQGVSPNYNASNAGPGGSNYRCSYQREIVLLHGGEGWKTGDSAIVTLDSAQGGGAGGANATYTITVEDHETTQVNATFNTSSPDDGLVRPEPTPFDSDTAVTTDTILGGILADLPTGVSGTIIGTGIYLFSDDPFNVEAVEEDLMRTMQASVNDVQNLPNQCKHGYIVKIANARVSEEDDYYLRFDGQNDKDGTGSWSECARPNLPSKLHNLPLVIQRTAATEFTVEQYEYQPRRVGDNTTNPFPSFLDNRVNKVLFFRNRLALLSGENVITSRPGTLALPDFFIESALTVSASDPIDISAASMFPSELFDGIEINTGLLVFSTNQQFLLSSDDTVLNPDTAKLRSISTFNYNETIAPISLGVTVGYIDNSGKFSRFNEMANIAREGEPNIVEVSKIVPTLLPKNIDLLTNSRENSLILIGKTNSDEVFGYKYFQVSDKRQQAAWFKWKLNNPLVYHFIINDEYFFLDSDYYLQTIKLVQTETDPSILQDDVDYLLHLDNHTTVSGGSFNPTTNITTFSGVDWLTSVTTPNHPLAVVDSNSNSVRVGRYAKPTASGTSFTLPGNWSGATFHIGFLYPYEVKFPTLHPTRREGQSSRADVNSSLIIHRLKLHFGKIGLYETTLERVGKPDYVEVYESSILDEYDVADAPFLEEFIKSIPVYERNTNVDIILKSQHPAPATLLAMSWEGDFSPRFYKRV